MQGSARCPAAGRSVRFAARRLAKVRKEPCLNNLVKNIGIWLVIGLVVLTVVKQFDSRQTTRDSIP